MPFLESLSTGFLPHGCCLQWNPALLWTFIAANGGIALAYASIPVTLFYFVRKRGDLPYPQIFILFATFIFSCGLTHVAKIWTIYQPSYWAEALIDTWTALISLLTAVALYPILPKLLALRSPAELEEANRKLLDEIEVRKAAELRAQSERDKAIAAQKLRSEFVANISHEIRTPISGVVSLAELLSMEPDMPTQAKEVATQVFQSSCRLLNVLNELLDFSKLESGKVTSETIEFSTSKLFDDVMAVVSATAKLKGIDVAKTIDPDLNDKLVGDEAKIRQVLVNFLHNAVKFTSQGTVRLGAQLLSRDGKKLVAKFSVEDTGIGIDDLAQEKIFEPFVQADGSTSRNYGGTGLGLSIAQRAVEIMGGKLGLESKLGQGTKFWFDIPLEEA
jgi:signal transduction histidine kinase